MLVQRAYKTELDLNDRQMTACRQHAGAARWAYNWGLRIKQERSTASKRSPTAIELHRELNGLKKTEIPWMYQVSKCAPQEALWNLDAAFQQFFRRCALKKQGKWSGKLGYPKYQDQEERTGQFPAHRLHRGVGEGDRVAAIGATAAQRAGVSSDLRGKDPLGHRERAGRTLVCVRAGGGGAGGTREYRTRGGY